MRYKHVIWDWNGTLLNDVWLCVQVVNELLARRGLQLLSEDTYRTHFEFPVVRFYQWLGLEHNGDAFTAISEQFINTYDERRFECSLQPEVSDVLQYLSTRGVDQVILSAYRQHTLGEVIRHYGLAAHFNELIGLDNFLAAGKLELGRKHFASIPHNPEDILLVGDTCHDFEVAREIGADCVLIDHGHQTRERLQACGVPVLNSLGDLLKTGFQGG